MQHLLNVYSVLLHTETHKKKSFKWKSFLPKSIEQIFGLSSERSSQILGGKFDWFVSFIYEYKYQRIRQIQAEKPLGLLH